MARGRSRSRRMARHERVRHRPRYQPPSTTFHPPVKTPRASWQKDRCAKAAELLRDRRAVSWPFDRAQRSPARAPRTPSRARARTTQCWAKWEADRDATPRSPGPRHRRPVDAALARREGPNLREHLGLGGTVREAAPRAPRSREHASEPARLRHELAVDDFRDEGLGDGHEFLVGGTTAG